MSVLDGFEMYKKKDKGNIFISITQYGITFSKTSVACLDYAEYVHIFFDKNNIKMAITPCEKDDEARIFVKNKNSPRAGFVRWNDKNLLKYVTELANLKFDEKGIRIKGEYVKNENVLIYDLNNYKAINGRK